MNIGPTEGIPGAGRIPHVRPRATPPPTPDSSATPATDRVEISQTARLLSELRSLPDIRQDRVEDLRRAIESGEYETPERLQEALDRFSAESADTLDLIE